MAVDLVTDYISLYRIAIVVLPNVSRLDVTLETCNENSLQLLKFEPGRIAVEIAQNVFTLKSAISL